MKTSDAQREATKNYQKARERFILWYPKDVKDMIDKELANRSTLPRQVFEAGLSAIGIKVPETGSKKKMVKKR